MALELHILSTEGLPEEGTVVFVSSRPKRQQSALPCQAPFKLEAKAWPVQFDFYAHLARSHSSDWEALSKAGLNSGPFTVSLASSDGRPMSIELQARASSGERVISSSLEAKVAAYFEHHKLPTFLRDNFDLLIKQRPADPYKFLAQRFHDAAFEEEKASPSKLPLANRHLINSKAVRQRARITLSKAAQDGRLVSALNRWIGQDAPKQLVGDEPVAAQKSLPPMAAVEFPGQAQAWNFNDVSSFLASTVVEEMSAAELDAQSSAAAKAPPSFPPPATPQVLEASAEPPTADAEAEEERIAAEKTAEEEKLAAEAAAKAEEERIAAEKKAEDERLAAEAWALSLKEAKKENFHMLPSTGTWHHQLIKPQCVIEAEVVQEAKEETPTEEEGSFLQATGDLFTSLFWSNEPETGNQETQTSSWFGF